MQLVIHTAQQKHHTVQQKEARADIIIVAHYPAEGERKNAAQIKQRK